MPVALALIIGLGALCHLALGRWVASPWLVPDLTLVSLVVAMARAPEHARNLVLLGGCLAMALAPSQPWSVGLAFVAAGGLVILLARRWDLNVPLTQLLATGAAETVLLALGGFGGIRLMPGLLLLAFVKLSVTMASVPLVRRLLHVASMTN